MVFMRLLLAGTHPYRYLSGKVGSTFCMSAQSAALLIVSHFLFQLFREIPDLLDRFDLHCLHDVSNGCGVICALYGHALPNEGHGCRNRHFIHTASCAWRHRRESGADLYFAGLADEHRRVTPTAWP